MTERETMLANCLDAPADDTARLVYADYLREHDSPVGRFLWAGVTLAQFRGQVVEDGMFFDAQRELNDAAPQVLGAQLKALFGWEWGDVYWDQDGEAGDRLTAVHVPGVPGGKPESSRTRNLPRHRERRPAAVYERGMLCGLRLSLSDWREYAKAVLRSCPLERIEVLDVPGLTFTVGLSLAGWRLSGELKVRPRGTQPARTWAKEFPSQPFPLREKFAESAVSCTDSVCAILHARANDRWPAANPPVDHDWTEAEIDEHAEQHMLNNPHYFTPEDHTPSAGSTEDLYESADGPTDSEDM